MNMSFVEELRRAGRYLLGSPVRPADRMFPVYVQEDFAPQSGAEEVSDTEVGRQCRRQAAFTMAAFLIGRVEKKDYGCAVDELSRLCPEERVAVAEKMVSINKQHRSIITSLPRIDFSYVVLPGGSRDVEFLRINDDTSVEVGANQSFCFRQDYCFNWR